MCDGGYELVASGGECSLGSADVESSHHLSNHILHVDGKIWMLNENNDDDLSRPINFLSVKTCTAVA